MISATDVAIFQLTQNILSFIVKVWCISEGRNDIAVLRDSACAKDSERSTFSDVAVGRL